MKLKKLARQACEPYRAKSIDKKDENVSVIPLHALPLNPVGQDYAQAAAHVGELTGQDANTVVVDIRMIHDADKTRPAIPLRGTLAELWASSVAWQSRGYGVFLNVNQLDGNGRELANVRAIRVHPVDLDNLSSQQNYERAAQFNPPPAFAVQSSPGRYHVYWTVQPFVGNERATSINRRLRTLFDGDKAVVDPSRVLRLAGTINGKYSDPASDKYNGSSPHLVTCWALGGYGKRHDPAMLEIALASVNVIEGGHGGRHELGDPSLAAPSLDHVRHGLDLLDPNDLDRGEWIATLAATKQAAWTHGTPDEIDAMLMAWCARYKDDNPGDDRKQIASIRNTELGWPSLLRRIPSLRAETLFGGAQHQLPPGASATPITVPARPQQQPHELDGYEQVISSATGDNGKNTLIETVKILHGNLPVAFDEFTQTILAISQLPWDKNSTYPRQWTETDTIHCQLYLQASFIRPGKETVHDAVSIIANRHRRHGVRDYLNTLQWDGIERLPLLAPQYFGTRDTSYTRTVGAKFMIGAVARVMIPGCKMDNVIILEGAQGKLKSSSIAALAGSDWFTDELPDLHTKDAAIQLAGKWVIEISELSAFTRSDIETIKKFMSRSNDRYRAPYERVAADHLRQCVFVATTNDEHYLKDQTGNRRFWPLACGTIDMTAIKQDRDQLWAEALTRYRNGERWWLEDHETKLAEIEQEERREVDPWEERITSHVSTLNGLPTTFAQICFVLNIPFDRLNGSINKRIAHCLVRAGYVRKQVRNGEHRTWLYVKE